MSDSQFPQWVTWAFSGVGIVIISLIYNFFWGKKEKSSPAIQENNQSVEINLMAGNTAENNDSEEKGRSIEEIRAKTKILFIDDDAKFKVVDILKRSGWMNTKSIRDIKDLNSTEVIDTHIFFVDIRGVGVSLGFKDEGLGLASAIKDKYPLKKVIIYSGETKGERFHEALKKADDSLPKNADPYEFEQIIENFSKDIFG